MRRSARGGQWESAMSLMNQLSSPELQLKPSALTFSLLISACERGRQWALVLRLYAALTRPWEQRDSNQTRRALPN